MKWTRYEILLPLRYNDGRPIERLKFRQTNVELLAKFSGTTADMITAIGAWRYQGTIYEDELVRLIVDVPASAPADDFFRDYKETLKARFQQVDIWISSHEIQIL
jgi:ATP-dependent protease HslVU (ClpYQ) peptidase subunit